jgi:plastocyanin
MKAYLKIALISWAVATFAALSANATTFQVQVGATGLTFTPQNITINVGDTIEWVWIVGGHSTTSGTPGHPDGLWDSGIQNAGFTFSQTFNTPGTFAYYCSPHGLCCGMIGSVIVNQMIDTVTITRDQYSNAKKQLTVQATDSDPTAKLTVSVTQSGMILGPMTNRGGGNYVAKFNGIANPRMITVTSDLGGSATSRVRAK